MASQPRTRNRRPVLKECAITPNASERRLPKAFKPLDFVVDAPRTRRGNAAGDEDTLQDVSALV